MNKDRLAGAGAAAFEQSVMRGRIGNAECRGFGEGDILGQVKNLALRAFDPFGVAARQIHAHRCADHGVITDHKILYVSANGQHHAGGITAGDVRRIRDNRFGSAEGMSTNGFHGRFSRMAKSKIRWPAPDGPVRSRYGRRHRPPASGIKAVCYARCWEVRRVALHHD